jgi:sugar/nucleoside kinase (ribokinase family)
MGRCGLFVGLITLDWLYLTAEMPDRNQKVVAVDYTMAAGGPATNAAIAFRYFDNATTLLATMGQHPISTLVQADLEQWGVSVMDLAPNRTDPLPTSSIIVTQATGERAVISINAVHAQAPASAIEPNMLHMLHDMDVVLIDGHQMQVGEAIAHHAKAMNIPIVIDGGSWKPGFEEVLPYADYVICSANFFPPGCQTLEETLAYLQHLRIPHIAISQGDRPIHFITQSESGEIPVPPIAAVDTLGAGDVLHGAFCHYIGRSNFPEALAQAAAVASRSCQSFGTRNWMKERAKP